MTDNTNLPPTRIEVFKDDSKKWRWRLISLLECDLGHGSLSWFA